MLIPLKGAPFAPGEDLTSVEMNILNDEITHAVDGIGGGTYALTASLIFSSLSFGLSLGKLDFANNAAIGFGSGVTIGGSPTWTGTITLVGQINNGALSFGGGGVFTAGSGAIVSIASGALFVVAAGATTTFTNNPVFSAGHTVDFNGTVHVNSAAEVVSGALLSIDSGGTLSVVGLATVGGTLEIHGTETIVSGGFITVASGGTFTIGSGATATIASSLTFNGTTLTIAGGSGVALGGIIQPTGDGHARLRIVDDSVTLDATITIGIAVTGGVVAGDVFNLNTITGNRTWTLSNFGAQKGDIIHVGLFSGTANTVDVRSAAAVQIALLQHGSGLASATIYFNGTDWQRLHLNPG